LSAYWDASTIATLHFQQQGWTTLRTLAEAAPRPCYSDFGFGEVVSAIGVQLRTRRADAAEGAEAVATLGELVDAWRHEALIGADIVRATAYLQHFALGLRLPDALHIAIAERLGLDLITADRRQAAAARALGVSVRTPLNEGA